MGKAEKVIARRLVVNVLESCKPDLSEEGLTIEQEEEIMKEYEAIINRLYKNAVKHGGEFNRYCYS